MSQWVRTPLPLENHERGQKSGETQTQHSLFPLISYLSYQMILHLNDRRIDRKHVFLCLCPPSWRFIYSRVEEGKKAKGTDATLQQGENDGRCQKDRGRAGSRRAKGGQNERAQDEGDDLQHEGVCG